jgi:hypothetical protein
MSKNAMRADLSRQMKKTADQHARIPHIGKSGTPYSIVLYGTIERLSTLISLTRSFLWEISMA